MKAFVYTFLFSLIASCNSSNSNENIKEVPSVKYSSGDRVTYQIDPTHSSIEFSVPFWGITQVKGRFDNFIGTITIDGQDIRNSKAEVFIESSSINTNNSKRDKDVIDNFLESAKHPYIHFRSGEFTKNGNIYKIDGTLTLHGVSREITSTFWFTGVIDEEDKIREAGISMDSEIIDRTNYDINIGLIDAGREFVGKEVNPEIFLRLRELSKEKIDYSESKFQFKNPKDRKVEIFLSKDQSERYEIHFIDETTLVSYNIDNREFLRELSPIDENSYLLKYRIGEQIKVVGDTLKFIKNEKNLGIAFRKLQSER